MNKKFKKFQEEEKSLRSFKKFLEDNMFEEEVLRSLRSIRLIRISVCVG